MSAGTSGVSSWGRGSSATSFTEAEKDCCALAARYFKSKHYQPCADVYSQVINDKGPNFLSSDSYRLKHNVLVCKFLKDNCLNVDESYTELKQMILRAETEINWPHSGQAEEPVLLYNLAVLYFHYKQYQNAMDVLMQLTQDLASIINLFSARVRLLLIEILIKLQQYEKALQEIDTFESQFKYPTRILTVEEGDTEKETELNREAEQEVCDKYKQLKILAFLGSNLLASAKREYRSLISIIGDSKEGMVIATHLKARHEFLRGNFTKAYKLLANLKELHGNDFWSTGDELDLILANNMGCLNYSIRKPNVACSYFETASRFCDGDKDKDKKKLPLHCRAYNKKYEVLYNLGVGLLQLNQHTREAYLYLSLCRKPFYANPRLWLRIAEACIKIYLENEGKTYTEQNEKALQVLQESLGTSPVPRLFKRRISETRTPDMELPPGVPQPTLTYASECIAIALKLIDTQRVKSTESDSETLCVKPSQPLTGYYDICRVYASALCTGAYISCLLHRYNMVVNYCTRLLILPKVSSIFIFFANMYMGEAFFKMSKTRESFECLTQRAGVSPSDDGRNTIGADERDKNMARNLPTAQFNQTDPREMESKITYNQVVVLLNSGNVEAARQHLESWIINHSSQITPQPEFLILLHEIYSKEGNLKQANSVLQKFKT